MLNDRKNYPPLYLYPEMPVDVSLCQSLNSLNNNILKYASKRGNSMYMTTPAAGVVGQTVTTANTGPQFLATSCYTGCSMGKFLDIALLVSVSAASRFRYWIGVFPPTEAYISTTAELQAEAPYAMIVASGAVDNTTPRWMVVRVPRNFYVGEIVSITIGCTNISGISASFNLYSLHEEWSE
jgi:hypothetical protein